MDFLLAEVKKKDKQLNESKIMAPGKKYFKRGDLAAKQAEEYWKKHKRLKTVEDELSESSQGNDSGSEATSSTKEKEDKQISRKELNRRLREREEPIKLFGETDTEAYERLKKLELQMPEIIKGFKNDLKAAMDKVDEEYLKEILQHGSAPSEQDKIKAHDVMVKDDGITMEKLQTLAEQFGQEDLNTEAEVVLGYLKLVLKIWGDELNSRASEDKRSFRGKLASATHTQTVDYIKPLFKSLKNRTIDRMILTSLVEVVQFLLSRDYLRANDAYLEMAIGNAPWPIGVTMVGIHARTGREKVSEKNVAHVLNDETQRKYIQAVKRLMTQSQKYFPTDPSKMVDYVGDKH